MTKINTESFTYTFEEGAQNSLGVAYDSENHKLVLTLPRVSADVQIPPDDEVHTIDFPHLTIHLHDDSIRKILEHLPPDLLSTTKI